MAFLFRSYLLFSSQKSNFFLQNVNWWWTCSKSMKNRFDQLSEHSKKSWTWFSRPFLAIFAVTWKSKRNQNLKVIGQQNHSGERRSGRILQPFFSFGFLKILNCKQICQSKFWSKYDLRWRHWHLRHNRRGNYNKQRPKIANKAISGPRSSIWFLNFLG